MVNADYLRSKIIEADWQERAKYLRGSPFDKDSIDPKTVNNPESGFNIGIKVLGEFLESQRPIVDACVLLYGALPYADILHAYQKKLNLLFYRPKTSHSRDSVESFLDGTPDPGRPLLLFDVDMVSGDTLRESYDRFHNFGYRRENLFAYLDVGVHDGKNTINSVKLQGPVIKPVRYLLRKYGGSSK
jgi:hypothetical protein